MDSTKITDPFAETSESGVAASRAPPDTAIVDPFVDSDATDAAAMKPGIMERAATGWREDLRNEQMSDILSRTVATGTPAERRQALAVYRESVKAAQAKGDQGIAGDIAGTAHGMAKSIPFAIAGGLVGGKTGANVGQAIYWSKRGIADIYTKARERGVPDQTARPYALGGGALYGMAEQIFDAPGFAAFGNKVVTETAARLPEAVVRSVLAKTAAKWAIGTGMEASEEAAQGFITDLSVELAVIDSNLRNGTDIPMADPVNIGQRVEEMARAVPVAGVGVGGVMAVNRALRGKAALSERERRQEEGRKLNEVLDKLPVQVTERVDNPLDPETNKNTIDTLNKIADVAEAGDVDAARQMALDAAVVAPLREAQSGLDAERQAEQQRRLDEQARGAEATLQSEQAAMQATQAADQEKKQAYDQKKQREDTIRKLAMERGITYPEAEAMSVEAETALTELQTLRERGIPESALSEVKRALFEADNVPGARKMMAEILRPELQGQPPAAAAQQAPVRTAAPVGTQPIPSPAETTPARPETPAAAAGEVGGGGSSPEGVQVSKAVAKRQQARAELAAKYPYPAGSSIDEAQYNSILDAAAGMRGQGARVRRENEAFLSDMHRTIKNVQPQPPAAQAQAKEVKHAQGLRKDAGLVRPEGYPAEASQEPSRSRIQRPAPEAPRPAKDVEQEPQEEPIAKAREQESVQPKETAPNVRAQAVQGTEAEVHGYGDAGGRRPLTREGRTRGDDEGESRNDADERKGDGDGNEGQREKDVTNVGQDVIAAEPALTTREKKSRDALLAKAAAQGTSAKAAATLQRRADRIEAVAKQRRRATKPGVAPASAAAAPTAEATARVREPQPSQVASTVIVNERLENFQSEVRTKLIRIPTDIKDRAQFIRSGLLKFATKDPNASTADQWLQRAADPKMGLARGDEADPFTEIARLMRGGRKANTMAVGEAAGVPVLTARQLKRGDKFPSAEGGSPEIVVAQEPDGTITTVDDVQRTHAPQEDVAVQSDVEPATDAEFENAVIRMEGPLAEDATDFDFKAEEPAKPIIPGDGTKPGPKDWDDALASKGLLYEGSRGKKRLDQPIREAIPNRAWLTMKEISDRAYARHRTSSGDLGRAVTNDVGKWADNGILERRWKPDGEPVYAWVGTNPTEGLLTKEQADALEEQPAATEGEQAPPVAAAPETAFASALTNLVKAEVAKATKTETPKPPAKPSATDVDTEAAEIPEPRAERPSWVTIPRLTEMIAKDERIVSDAEFRQADAKKRGLTEQEVLQFSKDRLPDLKQTLAELHGQARGGVTETTKPKPRQAETTPAEAKQPTTETLFTEDYTGPRFTYGLTNRPASVGAVPRGRIIGADKSSPDFRHGTIQYPRQLTDKEIADYELTAVREAAQAPAMTLEASSPAQLAAEAEARKAAELKAAQPPVPAARTVDSWARLQKNIADVSTYATPYVIVSRDIEGGRSRQEAYGIDGKMLGVASAVSGPTSLQGKFNRRKGKYFPADSSYYRIPAGQKFTMDWLKGEMANIDEQTRKDIAEADARVSVPPKEEPPKPPAPSRPQSLIPESDMPFNLVAQQKPTEKPLAGKPSLAPAVTSQPELFAVQEVAKVVDPELSASAAMEHYGDAGKALDGIRRQLAAVDADKDMRRAFTKEQRGRLKEVMALLQERAGGNNPLKFSDVMEHSTADAEGPHGGISPMRAARVLARRFPDAWEAGLIHIVQSPYDIPDTVLRSRSPSKIRGWYDPNTDQAFVVAGNAIDEADLADVAAHELVGHRGVMDVLGTDGANRLFRKLQGEFGAELRTLAERYGVHLKTREGKTITSSEVLANLSGKLDGELLQQPGMRRLWNRIVALVRMALRKVGYKGRLSEAEVRDLLTRAQAAAETPGTTAVTGGVVKDIRFAEREDFTPSERARAFRSAKAKMGTTTDLREAGYVLPDGTLLDFSGKRQGGGGGVRYMDHREIKYAGMPSGTSEGMVRFMQFGALRIDVNAKMVSAESPMSDAQMDTARQVIADGGYVDGERADGKRLYLEANDAASAGRVVNELQRFLQGENVAEGIRFSEREDGGARAEAKEDDMRPRTLWNRTFPEEERETPVMHTQEMFQGMLAHLNASPDAIPDIERDFMERYTGAANQTTLALRGVALKEYYEAHNNPEGVRRIAEFMDPLGRGMGRNVQVLSYWQSALSGEAWERDADAFAKEHGTEFTATEKETFRKMFKAARKFPAGSPEREEAQQAAVDAVAARVGMKPWEWYDAYRYMNMLSSPATHGRNIISAVLNGLALRPAMLAAGGDATSTMAYYRGMRKSLPGAVDQFLKAWHGMGTDSWLLDQPNQTAFEAARRRVGPKGKISGKLWKHMTAITRFLEAQDQFFKHIIQTAESIRLVETGEVQRLMKEDPVLLGDLVAAKIDRRAEKLANLMLFREAVGSTLKDPHEVALVKGLDWVAKKVSEGRNSEYGVIKYPVGMLVPFLRTPMAMVKTGVRASPLGYKRGQSADMRALANLGTGVMAMAGAFALFGLTTAAAPKDEKERELWYATGRKPWSFYVPGLDKGKGRWIPMSYLGPLMVPVGFAASLHDKFLVDPQLAGTSALGKAAEAIRAMAKLVSTQMPLQGVYSAVRVLSGDDSFNWEKFAAYTAGQLVPFEGLDRWVTRIIDPTFRKSKGFWDTLQKDLPGLSKSLPAYEVPPLKKGAKPTEAKRHWTGSVAYEVGKGTPDYKTPLAKRRALIRTRRTNEAKLDDIADKVKAGDAKTSDVVKFLAKVRAKDRSEAGRLRARLKDKYPGLKIPPTPREADAGAYGVE